MNIFSELKPEWHPKTPLELLDCSPRALKAIGNDEADVLRKVFGITTLSEMVTHPLIDWVWRTYQGFRSGFQQELPADAGQHLKDKWTGRSCGDWLGAPLNSLRQLSDEAGLLLGRTMGWVTIRNMAADKAFEAAREIHRLEKGELGPPGADQPKPLKDYFAGAAPRHIDRAREVAGLPPIPPAPPAPPPPSPVGSREGIARSKTLAPPPETPPPPSSASARETPAPPARITVESRGNIARSDTPLAGVTVTSGGPRRLSTHGAPLDQAEVSPFGGVPVPSSDTIRTEYTSDGNYIPKGGGSRGWYANEGVAKTERMNNYGYSQAIDENRFRSSGLENKVRLNLRGAERREVRLQLRYGIDGTANLVPALCLDVSLTGAKIRIGRTLRDGMVLFLIFVQRDEMDGTTTPFLQIRGEVMWCKSVDPNFKVQRFDCGLRFVEMSLDEKEGLSKVMMDRVDELVQAQQHSDEKAAEFETWKLG